MHAPQNITGALNALNIPLMPEREWSTTDVELIWELACAEARTNFWAFRCLLNPLMKKGWFQWEVAGELQRFWQDYCAGKRPVLVLGAPPQHGKSVQITDFIAWVAGQNPDLKTIFTSFSGDLGIKTNLYLQRMMDTQAFHDVFEDTRLADSTDRALRNSSLLEYVGHLGSFRNTTVEGQINGQGLDLGCIDDPIKGRIEAQSKTVRDSTWQWLTDDFFARFAEHAGMLMIMTRWHLDDTTGRWLERFPKTRILAYPAVAVEDERWRKKGEALFPEHKSLEFLNLRKNLMTSAGWESVYQQNPIIVGGGLFPVDKIKIVNVRPDIKLIRKSVRYWDKAGTEDGGAYTAGVLLHDLKDGGVCISDVRRGQWSALKRETIIKQTCQVDNKELDGKVETWIEQEPGSGGLESAERTILMLKGFNAKKDKVTGSKETRADPYAAQVEAGNVSIVAGDWNRAWLDEHEQFPTGKYKDQVDASGGAFAKGTLTAGYDKSMAWVDGDN
jgi:predicted phage terminase large subunit-like protein